MNKNRYRIVFNKVRNLMMAVAENTASQGKAKKSGSISSSENKNQDCLKTVELFQLRPLAFIALCVFGLQPVLLQAEIIADANAPGTNRPLIDSTANGIPLVHITSPSPAGVSRNQYSQFNVDSGGVILNNSQANVLTQQGGYVGSNPYLGNGSARIILNEVTGTGASSLRGYTEVAGQRAEVIIANPNGIICDGCGFINTSRGILTTGAPIMGRSGSLDSFRVTGGEIQIGAGGLNASNIDQLDLLARSLKVNGEIWAKNLNAVVGTNQIDYATLGVQVIAGEANKPTVGIDVALLGGMYANKIKLVGTEAGVGVKSLGNMAAQGAEFTLNNNGDVTLKGHTSSTTSLSINSSGDMANSGLLEGKTVNTTSNAFNNSGTVQSEVLSLNASTLVNQGPQAKVLATNTANIVVAGEINNAGSLIGGNITTHSNAFNNTGTVQADMLGLVTNNLNNNGVNARIATATSANLKVSANIVNSGTLSSATMTSSSQVFDNTGIVTADALTVNTGSLSNHGTQATITGNTTAQFNVTGNIDNSGTIKGSAISTHSNTLNNSGSILGETLALNAASLNNQSSNAKIIGNSTVDMNIAGDINNAGSIAGNAINTHSSTLNNTGSVLGNELVLEADNLNNTGAAAIIAATTSIDLLVNNTVRNMDGATIYSLGDLNAGKDRTRDANGYLANNMASFINSSATVQADGDLRISANNFTNKRSIFTWGVSRERAGDDVLGEPRYVHHTDYALISTFVCDVDGCFTQYSTMEIPIYTSTNPNYTPYYSTEFVTHTTPAAKTLAAGNMWLKGSINNEYSTIAAGGNITYDVVKYAQSSKILRDLERRSGLTDNWQVVVVGTACNGFMCFSRSDVHGWRNYPINYEALIETPMIRQAQH